jgi:hypothetical protein
MQRRLLKIGIALAASLVAAHLLLAALVKPLPRHPYWTDAAPSVIAHRGGLGLWPENTVYAFREAAELGADILEMDVRQSADGHLLVMHDETVDRTTDGRGFVATLALETLQRLDAGYRWSSDGGRTYPYRGEGLTVPTVREVFAALPGARMNLELKARGPELSEPLCRLIRERHMVDRVVVASFGGRDGGDRGRSPSLLPAREPVPRPAVRAARAGAAGARTARQPRGPHSGIRPRRPPVQPEDRRLDRQRPGNHAAVGRAAGRRHHDRLPRSPPRAARQVKRASPCYLAWSYPSSGLQTRISCRGIQAIDSVSAKQI